MLPALSPITTSRLSLVALRPDDSSEMARVLSDPGLYEFIGGEPPTQGQLRTRYESQAVGVSPDGNQDWLNWIARLNATDDAIGYTQATVDRAAATAELAWVIGVPWQRHGYAVEAVSAMAEVLVRVGIRRLIAHVHPDHLASQRVAAHAGLAATERVVDGEVEWELLI